ncbi:hypothetical protein P3S68_015160 [Capsicum galapagoense]
MLVAARAPARVVTLQRFVFVLKESWDYSTEQYWFPKLDFLTKVDFLRVEFESSNKNYSGPSLLKNWSWDFHFPSNLKILKLFNFLPASDSLSTIARLPNLEQLFLMRTIFQGRNGEELFSVLEKLTLWECRKLTEIPPNLGDIGSLKIIQLVESPQLEDSALEIKQYVEDITGEDRLQILGLDNIPLSKTDLEN